MSAPPSLSFRIQAPLRPSSTPPSRPTSRPAPNDEGDSSDDDLPSNRNRDELVTGFDARGLTKKTKDVVTAPLLIPSLPNLDWRSAASSKNGGGRKKKREMYVPDNGGRSMAMSGGKKAVGEREVINSTVVVGGLELGVKKEVTMVQEEEMEVVEEKVEVEVVRETEEQRALRELMTGAQAPTEAPPELDIIMPAAAGDVRGPPLEEGDAFKRDLMSRPDESTLEDYARVPVGQFGLALLRGMGWKVGTTASRSGRAGPVDAFVPSSRPSLLGIGAKPIAEVLGEPVKGKKPAWKSREEERKYVPVVRRDRDPLQITEGKSSESTPSSSRRPSPPSRRSPPPSPRVDRDRKSSSDRRDDRRTDERSSSRRDSDRDGGRRDRDRHHDNGRDRERERERDDRGKDRQRRDERDVPRIKRERSNSPQRGEYKERRSRSPRRDSHRDSRDGNRQRERDGERGGSSRRDERRDDERWRD